VLWTRPKRAGERERERGDGVWEATAAALVRACLINHSCVGEITFPMHEQQLLLVFFSFLLIKKNYLLFLFF
jgi:hypothetical protein